MYIAEKNFKPQTKKPEAGNPYFNQKPKGYSPCKGGKPLDKGLNVLANCTGWAIGRFNMETKEQGCVYWASMNAENFYAMSYKWGLEKGQEPRLGAVICWSGGEIGKPDDGKGHVAIVEQINNDGSILLSESGYNSYKFRTRKVNNKNGNWGASSKYKIQGFIYNPHIVKLAEPVERNDQVNQLEVIKNKLRIRVKPSLKADILDFAELGYYNDLETCEADGYTWHKIADNNWLAYVDNYVRLLPKQDFKVGDIVTLKEPITKYKITNIEDNKVSIIPITDLENLIKEEK